MIRTTAGNGPSPFGIVSVPASSMFAFSFLNVFFHSHLSNTIVFLKPEFQKGNQGVIIIAVFAGRNNISVITRYNIIRNLKTGAA